MKGWGIPPNPPAIGPWVGGQHASCCLAGKGQDSLKSCLLCPWASQHSIMEWLLVDNDMLSPE